LLLKVRNILAVQKARYARALADGKTTERVLQTVLTARGNTATAQPCVDCAISAAEQRVLDLLWRGCQDKEIADQLGLSVRTVSSHLSRLYRKTGTGNRVELIRRLFGPQQPA
jgi:DNA-binding NarL/FixJ family response regulator